MRLGRKIGMDLGWAALRLSESLVRLRGVGYALSLGRWLGRVMWSLSGVFLRRRRDLSLRNARVVLPDTPEGARRRIVRRAVVDSAANWPEAVNLAHNGPARVLDLVTVEGREHLEAALAKGKGVVAPTIHLGNYSLLGTWMGQAGYEFRYIDRVPHDARFQRRLDYLARLSGINLTWDRPRTACAITILRLLSRNGIVCILFDQRSADKKTGVFVEFFGRPFLAFTGAISLALRTGAAVVPIYTVRERGIRHRLVIEPEIAVRKTGDASADTKAGLESLVPRFEEWVRAHPGQWWWPNRRWEGV